MADKGIFDFVFYAGNSKTMTTKEDAYAYDLSGGNAGFISVFDGCGGLGSRKYPMAGNHTGAFLASRAACDAVYTLYEEKGALNAASIKRALTDKLSDLKEKVNDGRPELVGSMVKTFPTTVALASVSKGEKGVQAKFIWAGDSRGYVLDANGLMQITKDDITSDEDAFDNLYNDAPLSNLAHISGDFKLNEKTVAITAPSLILTATDGVFGYLPSPMHFEHLLLDTLMNASSVSAWEKAMEKKFVEISGDDATLVMTGCMMEGGFKKLQNLFAKRKNYLDKLLGGKADMNRLAEIWRASYKKQYEAKL